MALLLFCITSINAPTIPEVGAGVGGAVSWPSDTLKQELNTMIKMIYFAKYIPRDIFLQNRKYFVQL